MAADRESSTEGEKLGAGCHAGGENSNRKGEGRRCTMYQVVLRPGV
jgi:hypothetical protein